jgi:hypothetical protein
MGSVWTAWLMIWSWHAVGANIIRRRRAGGPLLNLSGAGGAIAAFYAWILPAPADAALYAAIAASSILAIVDWFRALGDRADDDAFLRDLERPQDRAAADRAIAFLERTQPAPGAPAARWGHWALAAADVFARAGQLRHAERVLAIVPDHALDGEQRVARALDLATWRLVLGDAGGAERALGDVARVGRARLLAGIAALRRGRAAEARELATGEWPDRAAKLAVRAHAAAALGDAPAAAAAVAELGPSRHALRRVWADGPALAIAAGPYR